MSRSDDFEDEVAVQLAIMTMIAAIAFVIAAILATIAAGAMIALLWQVYQRHARAGKPQADFLKRIAGLALAGFIVALLVAASDPVSGFWVGVITLLVWTYKVYEVGLEQEQLANTRSAEEMKALSSLATYLVPFDPSRRLSAPEMDARIVPAEKPKPLSMVVRMHAFGERYRNLGIVAKEEDFRSLGEILAYLLTPAPAELATETNVRLLLHQ